MMVAALLLLQSMTLPSLSGGATVPGSAAVMNEGGAAAVRLRVDVSLDGAPLRCITIFRNGPDANGDALCETIKSSVRFTPAMLKGGKSVAGVVHLWRHWSRGRVTSDDAPSWAPPHLMFEVNRLPANLPGQATFQLTVLVDAAGVIKHCEVREPAVSNALSILLCGEATKQRLEPVQDAQGRPVQSVQPYIVRVSSARFMNGVVERLKR